MFRKLNTKKVKLVLSIISLTLAFSFMTMGVYSAIERQLAVSGSLSFSSTSVDATITVSRATGGSEYTVIDTIVFTSGGGNQVGKDINLGIMAFSDIITTAKYKVLIEIEAGTRASSLVYADSATVPTGVTRLGTKKIGTGNPTALSNPTADTIATIAGGSSVEYEFTYTLTNPKNTANFSATSSISSTFTLART